MTWSLESAVFAVRVAAAVRDPRSRTRPHHRLEAVTSPLAGRCTSMRSLRRMWM